MGGKLGKSRLKNDDDDDENLIVNLASEFIEEISKWNQEKFEKIKEDFVCDGNKCTMVKLSNTQREVDIVKTLGASESIAGGALGIIGGVMLFTPAAPAGLIIGLTGLGLGLKGSLLEGGAAVAGKVAGKSVLKEFVKRTEDANIGLKNFVAILRRLEEMAGRLAKKEQQRRRRKQQQKEEQLKELTIENNEGSCHRWCLSVNAVGTAENEDDNGEDDDDNDDDEPDANTDAGDQPTRRQHVIFLKVLNFIATLWLRRLLQERRCCGGDRRSSLDLSAEAEAELADVFGDGVLADMWKGVQNGASLVSLGSSIHGIVKDSLFVARGGLKLLVDVGEESVGFAVGAAGSAGAVAGKADDVGRAAAGVVAGVGSTAAKVMNVVGIAGGVVGIAFSSYSIHQSLRSLSSGSHSAVERLVTGHVQNLEMGFMMRALVEENLKRCVEECRAKRKRKEEEEAEAEGSVRQ